MDFKELTLNDLSVGSKGHYGIAASATDFSPEKNRYIRISDINDDGTLNNNDPKSVDCPDASKYLIHKNDLLVARTGASTGRSYFCDKETNNMVYAGFLIKFSIDENKVNPAFIKYHFLSEKFRRWVYAFQNGATRENLNAKTLGQHVISLPPREYQDKVVDVLKSIDDKISVNNKIIDNLESSMVSLFNERCAKAPGKKTSLSKIACFLNGLAMQKFPAESGKIALPVLKIKELRQKFCDADSDSCSNDINDQYLVDDGDLIFSWSGSLLVDIWTGGRCGLNQHLFKVTSELYPKWFVYLWIKFHIDKFIAIAQAMATTMGHIKRKDLDKAEVIIPDDSELERWGKIFQPRLDLLINLRLQSVALTKIRNLLLPKLLSGEIKLSN